MLQFHHYAWTAFLHTFQVGTSALQREKHQGQTASKQLSEDIWEMPYEYFTQQYNQLSIQHFVSSNVAAIKGKSPSLPKPKEASTMLRTAGIIHKLNLK